MDANLQPVETITGTGIVIEHQNMLKTWLRLVMMELYKLRRRTLFKVLLLLLLGTLLLVFLGTGITVWSIASKPVNSFAPSLCPVGSTSGNCITHPVTQADLLRAREHAILSAGQLLTLPVSLTVIIYLLANILFLLIVAVGGTMMGGEYSLGTIRQLFIRGPVRLQFLWAKVGASLITILFVYLLIVPITVLLGYLFFAGSGMAPDFHFLTASWIGHALLLLGAGIASWLIYTIMAFFFATLGRSTTAGVVGPIVWIFMEDIISPLLLNLGASVHGVAGTIIQSIPNYFISTSITTLIKNQVHFLTGDQVASVSNLQAGSVLLMYTVVFLVITCWLTNGRDVTS